jgi:hypothetical protein
LGLSGVVGVLDDKISGEFLYSIGECEISSISEVMMLLHIDISTVGGIVFVVRIDVLEERVMNGNDRDGLEGGAGTFLRRSVDTSRMNICKICFGYLFAILEYLNKKYISETIKLVKQDD